MPKKTAKKAKAEAQNSAEVQTQELELKSVEYIKPESVGGPFFFQLRRVDPLTWECMAVEVREGKVVREFVVNKRNTVQYAKAYMLEAVLAQVNGKYEAPK